MHGGGGDPGPYSPSKVFGNVFIAFVGAGVLGLPYAFSQVGIVGAIVIMVATAWISLYAMNLLIAVKYEVMKRPDIMSKIADRGLSSTIDYGEIGYGLFGEKGWWAVQSSLVASQAGFACAYLIFISENLHAMIPSISTQHFLVGILVPLVALTSIRDLSGLGIFSLIADAANVFAYGVVFFFDFDRLHDVGASGQIVNFSGFAFFVSVAVYCFEGAGMILSLESSVPEDKRHEFPRLFKIAIASITALYVTFGVCGYISFGDETEKIITLNLPPGIFPVLVKGCLCFSLYFTYPVMMFPVSRVLDTALAKGDSLPTIQGNFLRAGLVALTGLIVVCISDFANIMGLIGSTCCMLLAFIMPGLFHLKLLGQSSTPLQRALSGALITIGVICGGSGLIDTLSRIAAGVPGEAS